MWKASKGILWSVKRDIVERTKTLETVSSDCTKCGKLLDFAGQEKLDLKELVCWGYWQWCRVCGNKCHCYCAGIQLNLKKSLDMVGYKFDRKDWFCPQYPF